MMNSTMDTYPVLLRFPLHWGEMDALGHVNNTRYFTWFESARIAYFRRLGMETGGPSDVGPILLSASCRFHRPLRYPADLCVGTRVVRVGNTSIEMEYAVFVPGEAEPAAVGQSVVVLFNYRTGDKIRVPDEMRAAILHLEHQEV